ncbi:alpha/beta-hydrolase [Gonapodya prolifera JEL478]|uniref:Alpha/beta-hydrolase n=1 Tax=Gonapodya prolifera (strain JEL478) TaxID=1344416 RepID=A0A139AJN1_GONPJ|nr:alpha/beta-hydrolase [Gonapodya prolifera JEL478]|eukprot:KXS17010.1 alpha/beta-hydrolase [Gonapodya prolifera JEL478]
MASILSSTISLVSNAIPGTAKALLTTEDGKKPSTPAIITQAALTIPKTVMGRLSGTSLNPQWSFPEEVVFNAMQVVATHSDTANASARLFLPRILDLQALACVEPIEPATATTWYDGGEVKGYWIGKPVDPAKDIVMLYIHGGSFIGGHPLQCCHALADLIRIMAKEKNLNARVFAVDYPLAPESPYPAGLDVCVRATKWKSLTIVLVPVGDSAGGNLALATILKIRDSGSTQHLHKILGCVPISPYVDFLGPRRSANESTENTNPFQVEKPTGSEAKKEDRWSAGADNLHLNAGRCAIRYYLGTRGLNWYSSAGGWVSY